MESGVSEGFHTTLGFMLSSLQREPQVDAPTEPLHMFEFLNFLKSYCVAIFRYWWLIIFGAPQIINNVWKWFHPQRKDAPIPHWFRATFGVLAIVIATG